MATIRKIWADEILDSRGFPTIRCSIMLDNDLIVQSSAPSGASVGKLEALELRDQDMKRYFGKGVLKAIFNVEKIIAPELIGKEPDLFLIDKLMIDLDGTKNKSKLGANAILAVSMAVARAQAKSLSLYLYQIVAKYFDNNEILKIPNAMFNILNGGVHASNGICFQEFMIMPIREKSFALNLQIACIIYHNLKNILHKEDYSIGIGDEGGFAPRIVKDGDCGTVAALNFLVKAVEKSGFVLGKDVVFCLDVAATQFYDEKEKKYILKNKKMHSDDLINFYHDLISHYPIYSIEDGLAEQDWQGWKNMTEEIGTKVQLVGDDIFVTNIDLIHKGVVGGVANAVLIKPNQIGTITETINAIKLCKNSKYKTIISHRSGDTCDSFIADLAVGANCQQFKSGACARGERVSKYNRLLEIEKQIIS
ncbi:phosphopyruvate hydratase [Candidatus Dependentiae bacterium]|nr:phosphopyruvate hydratase [Candidatus Dependentiae bacterium]